MNWSDALGSAIEVAVSIAGFSGIVAAVGRRGAGEWTPEDQIRLRAWLTASGVYVPTIGFLLLNTAVLGVAWPYVLEVIVQLFVSFMTFVQLLLGSWHTAR